MVHLRIAAPAMTNEFIALFKNTTFVPIGSIFGLLGIAQALTDPAWVGIRHSREKQLQAAHGC